MGERFTRRAYFSAVALAGVVAGCLDETSPPDQDGQQTDPTQRDSQPSAQDSPDTSTEPDDSTPVDPDDSTETEADPEQKAGPEQPKIREVQDNFGNTFTFDGDASDSVRVDDEIIVTDETDVELCVTEVAKRETDTVTYSYWFGHQKADHPDNTAGDARIETACRTWDMQREDYASDWVFTVWIRNEDDIHYHNSSNESDYRATIRYTNLTLGPKSEAQPDQPKIREVQDNFGNTFTFAGDASDAVQVDDEIVVSDETEVELCVTELDKQATDTITYSYWFGHQKADHPDNTAGDARISENCRTWEMRREDYASDWVFTVWIRNEDDIYYHNSSNESDYRVTIRYTNLTLES